MESAQTLDVFHDPPDFAYCQSGRPSCCRCRDQKTATPSTMNSWNLPPLRMSASEVLSGRCRP